jgi:hypothetical protein
VVHTKFDIYVFITCPWVDTSAVGLLVLDGIILPAVGALALTWFIIDILEYNPHQVRSQPIYVKAKLTKRFWEQENKQA